MSRPKKFKYKHGEITLSGFSKEENLEIEAILLNKPEPKMDIVYNESTSQHELVVPKPPLDKVALGFLKVDKMFKCVKVIFSLESNEAKIDKVEDLGTNVNIADSRFSVKVMKEFFS